MKPMLAASAANFSDCVLPAMASPKLDGVRCIVINGKALSRSLKPIPNKYVQSVLGSHNLNWLDGELVVGDCMADDVFSRTSSGVMSVYGEPQITFHIFDDASTAALPFYVRLKKAKARINALNTLRKYCKVLDHFTIAGPDELEAYEESCVGLGYEGIMLRAAQGPYKYGRSTLKEGYLVKLKRFIDSEARILGGTSLLHNSNVPTTDNLGLRVRSSHKAGKVDTNKLGSLQVKDVKTGIEFDIGTGFTESQRELLWSARDKLVGQIVKYKSQAVGPKDKPRFPVFIGFRNVLDM